MAFEFTCYGNDEGIESTSIYADGINQYYTVNYGETLHLAGFTAAVKFTAVPAEGYSFTRWVYRLGSTTGTVQYSTSNPFTYSGDEDIFIQAESNTTDSGGDSGDDSGDDNDYTSGSLDYWDWYCSNGNASDEDTELACNAVVNNGNTTDFSHLVWNDMVKKVMYILDYLGDTWQDSDDYGNYLGTYEETLMLAEPYELTADKFNAMLINIDRWYSTDNFIHLDTVYPDDEVLGIYFLVFSDCINGWIDLILYGE